jgi:hypothetical protein
MAKIGQNAFLILRRQIIFGREKIGKIFWGLTNSSRGSHIFVGIITILLTIIKVAFFSKTRT